MTIFQALILGIIEGLTEFLPVSSTGHLILAGELLKIPNTEFTKTFDIAIQSGAMLSIIVVYLKRLLADLKLVSKIAVAFLPTALFGFIFYDFVKSTLLESPLIVVAALFWGGILLIAIELFIERFVKQEKKQPNHEIDYSVLNYRQAALIGVFQAISMVPGVSRAAASIIGGLFVGLNRRTAVEFSFLLAVPTILAATGLDLIETNINFSSSEWLALFVGFSTSFVVALVATKWFIKFVATNTFVSFGIYRIILALIFFLFFL